jgi:uncharacterized protein (UPF0248 family)
MTPIHKLSRIRWDKEFGSGKSEIGYLGHAGRLDEVTFPQGERRAFELVDETGQARRIPFHRVMAVWRNGEVIWKRRALSDGLLSGKRREPGKPGA